jgi:heme exporter protein A
MTAGAFSPNPLDARAITLQRGGIPLIENLSLTVQPGEAVVLLGRNGVGKTTFLRALAGVLRPAGGGVYYGDTPVSEAAARSCALLGHENALKPDETPRQSLTFWSRLAASPISIQEALTAMGLRALADRPTRRLSQGQKRRVALARLLVLDRPVWLLDEPAAPLDSDGRQRLSDIVMAHRARGGLVIAATHQTLDWPDARTRELVR